MGAQEEGIAIGLVYDTSGSMNEPVRTSSGKTLPKYQVAQQALSAIIDQVQTFSTNKSSGRQPQIEAGLFVFKGDNALEAVKFGPWKASAFQEWIRNFKRPDGSTPLGKAMDDASRAVLKSKMSRKHLVVITDGVNTVAPDPASVLRRVNQDSPGSAGKLSVHVVAFDIAAALFDPLKKEGATVVGAADAKQLHSQLEYIFERKILLEDEEAPAANKKRP